MEEAQDELLASVVDLARDFAEGTLRPANRQAEQEMGPPPSLKEDFAKTGLDTVALAEPGGAGLGAAGLFAVTKTLAEGDPGLAAALMAPAWLDHLGTGGDQDVAALVLDPVWQAPSAGAKVMALTRSGAGQALYLAPSGGGLGPLMAGGSAHPVGLAAAGIACLAVGETAGLPGTQDAQALWREAVLWPISLMLGAGRAALAAAIGYALARKAFGQPLSAYQGVSFPLADAATWLEAAEALTERAIFLHGAGSRDAHEAMLQALLASRQASFKAGDESVQTLGGAGFVSEFPVELWFRDAVAAGALTGQTDHYTLLLGQEVVS